MLHLIQSIAFVVYFSYSAWGLGDETNSTQIDLTVDKTPYYDTLEEKYTRIEPVIDAKERYQQILAKLQEKHYKRLEINDVFSKRYLNSYIESLDPQKSYFLQSDIVEFNKWSDLLDDLLLRGDISPGYIMYNRFLLRAEDQLLKNLTLLKSDFEFDLTGTDELIIDAEKRTWIDSPDDAIGLWHKRIKDSLIRLILNDKDPDAARELIIKRYENQLKQLSQRNSDDVFQLYVNAFTTLYDPHTAYYSPQTSENFQINMSLSLEGIGAELLSEDDYTKVVRVIPGGPADLQGILKAEDKIVGVGQGDEPIVDVVGWRIDDVVALIRGPKDSVVRLQVLPFNSETIDIIEIIRDKVKLEERSAQKRVLELSVQSETFKIGVIEIPAFYMDFEAYQQRDPDYKSTSRDVFKLLRELSTENINGIVLDLRNNSGGSLTEAIQLTDLFIETGPVVQIRDSKKRVSPVQKAKRRSVYRGPLIVMINRLSASATEIFAGALQDYGRALVVGSQSYGKGTVQDITGLTKGQLKMTISKFYRVSGDSTQNRGIIPDITFPSRFNIEEIGETHKENALPWDRIAPVSFDSNQRLKQVSALIMDKHKARSSAGPDYIHLMAQNELVNEWQSEDKLSLNLDSRRQRLKEWDSRNLLLENARRIGNNEEPFATVKIWKEYEAAKIATTHKVEWGDTLSEISIKYDMPVKRIIEDNSISNPDAIPTGSILRLDRDDTDKSIDTRLKEASHILIDQIRVLHSKSNDFMSQSSDLISS